MSNLSELAEAKAAAKLALLEKTEKDIADWEYLLHHVVTKDGEETLHHCFVVDHLGNKYEIDHLVVKGKTHHVVKGLAPDQDVYWSDEEATEAGDEVPCANRQLK